MFAIKMQCTLQDYSLDFCRLYTKPLLMSTKKDLKVPHLLVLTRVPCFYPQHSMPDNPFFITFGRTVQEPFYFWEEFLDQITNSSFSWKIYMIYQTISKILSCKRCYKNASGCDILSLISTKLNSLDSI